MKSIYYSPSIRKTSLLNKFRLLLLEKIESTVEDVKHFIEVNSYVTTTKDEDGSILSWLVGHMQSRYFVEDIEILRLLVIDFKVLSENTSDDNIFLLGRITSNNDISIAEKETMLLLFLENGIGLNVVGFFCISKFITYAFMLKNVVPNLSQEAKDYVKELLSIDKENFLHYAAYNSDLEVFNYFVESGVNINQCDYRNQPCIQKLIHKLSYSELKSFCEKYDDKIDWKIVLLYELNLQLYEQTKNDLFPQDKLLLLLHHGVDINMDIYGDNSRKRNTLLSLIINKAFGLRSKKDKTAVVKLLVENGAFVSMEDCKILVTFMHLDYVLGLEPIKTPVEKTELENLILGQPKYIDEEL